MTAADIERYNQHTLVCVACAALEDLVGARLAHGSESLVYRQQVARSMCFIEGSLEALLTAAVRELDRCVRDGCAADGVAADVPTARR